MNIKHHPNPITGHNMNVNAQLPKGAKGQPAKGAFGKRHHSRGMKGFYEPRGKRGKVITHVGIGLVKWFLDNGMKEEARELLEEIKSGRVDPRTGEKANAASVE